jgi:hypothetical protein
MATFRPTSDSATDSGGMSESGLEFQKIKLERYSARFSADDPAKTLRPSANVTFFAFAKLDWSLAR